LKRLYLKRRFHSEDIAEIDHVLQESWAYGYKINIYRPERLTAAQVPSLKSTIRFSGDVAVNAAIEKVVTGDKLKFVTNHKLSCGDGGVSFGQAVLAARSIYE
jgi:hydrogenase maturation factor HypF (carbamoyltransferase family)